MPDSIDGTHVHNHGDESDGGTVLNPDSLSLKQLSGAVGIVAPSQSKGYDSVTAAINDSHDEVWLMEDISENGIPIPAPNYGNSFVVRGIGGERVITDPDQDGTPILDPDTASDSWNVQIENIEVQGGAGSGRSLDANFSEAQNGTKPHRWTVQNCTFKAGPPIFGKSIRSVWDTVNVEPSETTDWTSPYDGTVYTVGAPVFDGDTTLAVRNCLFNNTVSDTDGGQNFGAWFANIEVVNLSDGTVFNNAGSTSSGTAGSQLVLDGCEAANVDGCWFETKASVKWDIRSEPIMAASKCHTATVTAPNIGNDGVRLISTQGFAMYRPRGGGTVSNDGGAKNVVVEGKGDWTTAGTHPEYVVVEQGAASMSAGQQGSRVLDDGGFQCAVYSAAPANPHVGMQVIADGTNWDPDGDGAAERVEYVGSTNGWNEVVGYDGTL